MSKPREILIALIATATLLAGCAASQQAREVQQSGFLGQDYDLVRPGEEGEALLVYRNAPGSRAAVGHRTRSLAERAVDWRLCYEAA